MSDWQQYAACDGQDVDLFFPISSRGQSTAQINEAKGFCKRCPARQDCLDEALENNVKYGIWGGLTEVEREQLRRRRMRQANAA